MKKLVFNKTFAVKRSSAGLGLFTNKPFKKGDFVIEYKGPLITTAEADRRGGRYLFDVNKRWTIDGKSRKNKARYINHSCRPNCEVEIKGKKILVYAIRAIPKGAELSYNYGKEYFNEYIRPHGCRCAKCRGK